VRAGEKAGRREVGKGVGVKGGKKRGINEVRLGEEVEKKKWARKGGRGAGCQEEDSPFLERRGIAKGSSVSGSES